MEINCPKCGTENWLENQSRCFRCDAILRRCFDCANYERGRRWCANLDTDIELREAQEPSVLAISTNCHSYRNRYCGPTD